VSGERIESQPKAARRGHRCYEHFESHITKQVEHATSCTVGDFALTRRVTTKEEKKNITRGEIQ
jgi:hypothetical protein